MNKTGRSSLAAAYIGKTGQQPMVPNGNRGSVGGGALEFLLQEVISRIQPSQDDREKRSRMITKIKMVLTDLEPLKGASIKPFGSFVSDLYTRCGDLDISIELAANGQQSLEVGKNKKRKLLNNIKQVLILRGVARPRSVQLIPSARVPLLIFEDSESQISCDISINNGSGLFKSKFLYWICQIDTRFRELVYLIKHWAKAHNINDPKSGTLNSFSLSLLVIFHLQKQSPPILPPIKDIYDGDIASDLAGGKGTNEMEVENRCLRNVEKFKLQAFSNQNKSSVSDLFISFFALYASAADKWLNGLTVCTFTGKWGNTSSREYRIAKKYAIVIEDPFDHTENCARSVTESTLKIISDELLGTNQLLQRLPMLSNMDSLHQILFGSPHETPRPYILPSQETILNTSRRIEDDTNRGRFMQASQRSYNPPVQRNQPTFAARSVDSLSATFSQGSLDERSMTGQPKIVSTSSSIYRHQAQPSSYGAIHNFPQQHYPSERMQPTPAVQFMPAVPNRQTWKPKNRSQGI
ncbi:hypothetical protein SUGI_0862850 [Cryptomeria japonica]|uniref:protein HESO1 isoform X2 n=1 Tax=Cryptomeria japonica TaxID=3369 RepID=UPI002414B977|nr:protein HESO1 isoform X2 [Cryptomeria japonica]GLJ41689.1 hypothetical protein SUGI_0862850 [Cryptomeria japonica]